VYDYEGQYNDVKKSKDLLEKWTGQKIRYFSYPFGGKRDYNKETLRVCEELGFDMAFANFYGQVHSWTNKYQIPRCLVRNWDFEFFKSQINKVFKY
jgi:peptidoglycan/xylan/chitin deacetylase (PgdA/CDA1 family)